MRRLLRSALIVGLAFLGLPPSARAHDPGISTAQGVLRSDRLELTTGFAPVDIQSLLPASAPRAESWMQAEFDAARDRLRDLAPSLWEVRADGKVLELSDARVELLPGDNVSFHLLFGPLSGATSINLRATRLPDLPGGHRQFVVISDENGLTRAKKLLSVRDFSIDVPVASKSAHSQSVPTGGAPVSAPIQDGYLTAVGFIRLGVEHIWTGYDHLLFLFGLLLVCRSFRSMVGIVTCFTLAHSLTLAMATLDIVNLPSRFVEGMIAASILYVGVENLFRRSEEPRGRWAVTFGFGLVHGFGFASVLRDLGLGGGSGVLMPLFAFNLGVELGQIAVAAVLLPIIWRLRKGEQFVARAVPALSVAVAAAGLFWLLQRTVFS